MFLPQAAGQCLYVAQVSSHIWVFIRAGCGPLTLHICWYCLLQCPFLLVYCIGLRAESGHADRKVYYRDRNEGLPQKPFVDRNGKQ